MIDIRKVVGFSVQMETHKPDRDTHIHIQPFEKKTGYSQLVQTHFNPSGDTMRWLDEGLLYIKRVDVEETEDSYTIKMNVIKEELNFMKKMVVESQGGTYPYVTGISFYDADVIRENNNTKGYENVKYLGSIDIMGNVKSDMVEIEGNDEGLYIRITLEKSVLEAAFKLMEKVESK